MAPNQANKLSSTGVAAALSQLGHTNSSGLDSACCPLSTPPHAHSNCFPHRTPNPGWLALENESIGKGAGPRGFGTVGQGMLLHPVTPFSNDWSGVHVTRILDWAKEIVIISCLVGLQGSCCVARRPVHHMACRGWTGGGGSVTERDRAIDCRCLSSNKVCALCDDGTCGAACNQGNFFFSNSVASVRGDRGREFCLLLGSHPLTRNSPLTSLFSTVYQILNKLITTTTIVSYPNIPEIVSHLGLVWKHHFSRDSYFSKRKWNNFPSENENHLEKGCFQTS